MKRIWKYPLRIDAIQTVRLPAGAEPLHVGVQGAELMMWAQVDPSQPEEDVGIEIYGTGHETHSDAGRRYIGSAPYGDLVWHVFIRTSPGWSLPDSGGEDVVARLRRLLAVRWRRDGLDAVAEAADEIVALRAMLTRQTESTGHSVRLTGEYAQRSGWYEGALGMIESGLVDPVGASKIALDAYDDSRGKK